MLSHTKQISFLYSSVFFFCLFGISIFCQLRIDAQVPPVDRLMKVSFSSAE